MLRFGAIPLLGFLWTQKDQISVYCDHNYLGRTSVPFGKLRVKFVQVISRHGDRSPITLLHENDSPVWQKIVNEPTFLQSSPIVDPVAPLSVSYQHQKPPLGILTKTGAEQMKKLGEYVRNRYFLEAKFLPENIDPNIISVRSSPLVRTQKSAQAFLLGLYPVSSRPNKETVSIHSYFPPGEPILSSTSYCPRIFEIVDERKNDEIYKEKESEYLDVKETLKKVFPHSAFSWIGYFESLYCYKQHNIPLPPEIDDNLLARLSKFIGWRVEHTRPKSYSVLRMDALIRELLENQELAIVHQTPYKIMYYSGHDTTILPWLIAYDVFDGVWPGYSSSLIIELLEDDDANHFVRVLQDGRPLEIPGCGGSLCNFETFRKITLERLSTDVEKDCKVINPSKKYTHRNH